MASATCQRCQNGTETKEHVFRECSVAKETWEKLGFNWPTLGESTGFKDRLICIFELNSLNKCRVIACAMWVIWASRNRFIHEREEQSGTQMANFITNYIKELDGLSMRLPVNRLQTGRWVAPTDSWV
ncbi:hypothetical protein ES288_A12G061600v1 [Gossypium darwinii]|uniref:Reverse transcriptase zinc-binding domain-containing protein n=1 Tax=Gossypium darwinii TaxID=34276 RepID=A0A5D2E6T0_GOSDA|nr:hypothetical protein ES288_A12G061600v1 [Gossypium darwinii]